MVFGFFLYYPGYYGRIPFMILKGQLHFAMIRRR